MNSKMYNEFFEMNSEYAMELIRSGRQAKPFLFMVKGENVTITPLSGFHEGFSPVNLVKPIVSDFQPEFYMVLSEAWCKILPRTEESRQTIKNMKYGDIEKMKNKIEVLMLMARSIDGKYERLETWEIIRSDRKIDLKKQPDGKFESSKLP